jgi:hypothetical protein
VRAAVADEQPAAASAASATRPANDRLTVDDMNAFPHSSLVLDLVAPTYSYGYGNRGDLVRAVPVSLSVIDPPLAGLATPGVARRPSQPGACDLREPFGI